MRAGKLISASVKAFAGICTGAVGIFGLIYGDEPMVTIPSVGLAGSGVVLLQQAYQDVKAGLR